MKIQIIYFSPVKKTKLISFVSKCKDILFALKAVKFFGTHFQNGIIFETSE